MNEMMPLLRSLLPCLRLAGAIKRRLGFTAILTPFVFAGCATWRCHVTEYGFPEAEVACARTYYVGDPPHHGSLILDMNPDLVRRVSPRIHQRIPELRELQSAAGADLILLVMVLP